MKILSLIFLSSFFNYVHAQSVETTIDGETYICRLAGQAPGGGSGNAVDCINIAYAGPFSREESHALCQGARNTGPALCAIKAYAGPFSRAESVSMCKGARSSGPIDCFVKAYAGPFSRDESMRLCQNNPYASVATAECAIKAYSGPYGREESISLCTGTHKSLINVSLKALSDDAFDELVIRANERAMAEGLYKK